MRVWICSVRADGVIVGSRGRILISFRLFCFFSFSAVCFLGPFHFALAGDFVS